MIQRLPSSFCSAVSGHPSTSVAYTAVLTARCISHRQLRFQHVRAPTASKPSALEYSPESALLAIESQSVHDRINGPRSTLPPPLHLPERKDASSTAAYWWSIGRAYGTFYKEGVKAVWYNNKAAGILKTRISKDAGDPTDAAVKGLIERSEWQVLARNRHDVGKLPFFGVLALIFGEWLPLIVPFIPAAVPGTCRIPKQVVGMRETAEKRRKTGRILEPKPSNEVNLDVEGKKDWPMTDRDHVRKVLSTLRHDQLYYLSTVLNIHNRFWDLIQLPPPAWLLRSGLSKRLQYLAVDDMLLLKLGHEEAVVQALKSEELAVACEERGLDVSQWPERTVRDNLTWWLKRAKEDQGRGRVMLTMLFRRSAAQLVDAIATVTQN